VRSNLVSFNSTPPSVLSKGSRHPVVMNVLRLKSNRRGLFIKRVIVFTPKTAAPL